MNPKGLLTKSANHFSIYKIKNLKTTQKRTHNCDYMCTSLPQKNTKNRNQIRTRVNFQENPNSYLTFLPIYNYFCQCITRIESLQNTAVLEKFWLFCLL